MKEIIKKIIPLIIVILAINAVVYTFTAFITWQSDPSQWDIFTRFIDVLFMGALSVVAIGVYVESINED